MKLFVSALVTLVSVFTLTFVDYAEAQSRGRDRRGPNRGGPDRGGGHDRRGPDRRPDMRDRDYRRGEVRRDRDRDHRRDDRSRWHNDRYSRRNHWRRQPHWVAPRRAPHYRDSRYWAPRYNIWIGINSRPSYFRFSYNWRRPMPTSTTWTYMDIEVVADNIEDLSKDIYQRMYNLNPNMSFSLRQTLADLADAAENFNDSIERHEDFDDTLYDLFYLDQKVNDARSELSRDFYGNSVANDMQALRYYVDEMLFTYRQYR